MLQKRGSCGRVDFGHSTHSVHHSNPLEHSEGQQKRLQYLKSQRETLEKQLRNANAVLGGLEERVQALIQKAGRLGESTRKIVED